MKIVVTGSLGNISKPLTQELVEKGHSVTVISSNPERKAAIEALGANAAIGKMEDADFLTSSFTGAEVIYIMLPLNFSVGDLHAYLRNIAQNYAQAIKQSGVKRMIFLSGWVAGVIDAYKDFENIFNNLPDVSVTHIRPGYFYSNFFESMEMIRDKGIIAATFGGEDKIVFSAPSDIADAIANEIQESHQGERIRYVASDGMTCNEAAEIIGTAIGKPQLKWVTLSDDEMQTGLEMAGLSPKLAAALVQMQAPIHQGLMPQEFYRHKSEVITGKIKLSNFAKDFARVFHGN